MMMTTEELEKNLLKISKRFNLVIGVENNPAWIDFIDHQYENRRIYDFFTQKYNAGNCLNYIPDKIHDLNKLLDEYYEGRNEILARESEDSVDSTDTETQLKGHTAKEMGETAKEVAENWKKFDTRIAGSLSEGNPFKEYTDHLAQTLLDKNKAYGDSFTKSVDTYGLSVIGVRLSDKYNRIEHLINENMFTENGESLQDTLLDMAGYSILALKYLKEHRDDN